MPSGIHSQGPSHIPPYHQQSSETTKKPRTQFTPKQLYYLEEKFEKNRFPNAKEREAIAKELDLTLNHIQVSLYINNSGYPIVGWQWFAVQMVGNPCMPPTQSITRSNT